MFGHDHFGWGFCARLGEGAGSEPGHASSATHRPQGSWAPLGSAGRPPRLDAPLPSLAAAQEGEPCALEVYRKQDSDGTITVDLYQTRAFPRANGLYTHTLTHMHAVTHLNAYTPMSMHTHAHTCIHSNACTYMHACTHAHVLTLMHTLTCMHMHSHMHTVTHIQTHASLQKIPPHPHHCIQIERG